jgi:hypothetical protein
MIEKKFFGFPFHYGDTPSNEGDRLSDKVVTVVQTKKFQNICSALFSAVLVLGGQARVSNAIPPEAGEHIANAADAAVNAGQVADLAPNIGGRVAGGVANAAGPLPLANQNPVPVKDLPIAKAPGLPGYAGGPPVPGPPPVYMPLGRPITPVARTTNSILFTSSLAWICVNAYWGNPVALAGCSVMVAAWFGNVLGVSFGK